MSRMNYYPRKNPLAAESDFPDMARVARKKTLRQDDVIDRMLKKNTTVTRQDILVVLDLMKETVMEEALSRGGTIELRGRGLKSDGKPEVILMREGSDEPVPVARIFNFSDRSILFALPADLEAGTGSAQS